MSRSQIKTLGSKKDIKYVGLKNYTDLISDERFTHSLLNLFKFTVVFILGALITGFIMALLLEKGIKGEGFFRSFYLYPMAISFIAMGTVFNWILNSARDEEAGGLNLALQKIGLGFLQNDWYVSEKRCDVCNGTAGDLADVWLCIGTFLSRISWYSR